MPITRIHGVHSVNNIGDGVSTCILTVTHTHDRTNCVGVSARIVHTRIYKYGHNVSHNVIDLTMRGDVSHTTHSPEYTNVRASLVEISGTFAINIYCVITIWLNIIIIYICLNHKTT